jgi:hypothetical protein
MVNLHGHVTMFDTVDGKSGTPNHLLQTVAFTSHYSVEKPSWWCRISQPSTVFHQNWDLGLEDIENQFEELRFLCQGPAIGR